MADDPTRAERQKRRDRETYDGVAQTFEQLSDRFTQPLAEWMVEAAEIRGEQRVLDVGTGTGIVALEAARRLAPGGRVLGIDLSPGMLARAEARAREQGLAERVAFAERDAESLGLEDASQDRVLSLYALLHFPDPAAALAEMHRVLRPGGVLVIAIGRPPARTSLQGIAYAFRRLPLLVEQLRGQSLTAPAFLEHLVAQRLLGEEFGEEPGTAQELGGTAQEASESGGTGPVLGGTAPELGGTGSRRGAGSRVELPASRHRDSRRSRVDSGTLAGLLVQAGFERVRTAWDARLGVLSDAGEFWDLQATFSSYARDHLLRAGETAPERVAALRRQFDERCQKALRNGGRLLYPYAAYYAVAHRPAAAQGGPPA